jgi:hypothetical protein
VVGGGESVGVVPAVPESAGTTSVSADGVGLLLVGSGLGSGDRDVGVSVPDDAGDAGGWAEED